ncbi:GAF domain-containing protein [Branchiibius hedensis]|uniref:GAF domain-containing protein n=1 Tax=Branchiibius hedensis TaxID=672460 RepID=A0A2Y8ZN64_9MICO|nr:LuxR C-terminal-related transcriptional regulator [Branchiibius hedensis]PWJ23940.1 GAF domain-containing protein [Branchiibius hedensis]SSA32758.1 GAF domain-containing protein [Branchiibius hedensis]
MAVLESTVSTTAVLADLVRSIGRLTDHAEILDSLPPMISRMGFDRAIVSEVVDGSWLPAAVYVPRDRRWSDDIREAGRSAPPTLGIGMVEDDMLVSRRPIVVGNVRGNPRVHQGIAQVSRSSSFAAAPICVGDRIDAIVHVDRFWTRMPFGAEDVFSLQLLADAVGLVLEREVLRKRLRDQPGSAAGNHAAAQVLTARERQVAEMICAGLTNTQIAQELVVAEATVKTHVKHILRKLGARHRAEVVSMFLRSTGPRGLIPEG